LRLIEECHMRPLPAVGIAVAVLGMAGPSWAQSPRCADITDPTQRLVCYDRLSKERQAAPPARPRPAPPAQAPSYDASNVGKDGVPVPPEDRAFDPRQQRLSPDHAGLVVPQWRRIGSVPIRSGPNTQVPVVTLELPSLRAIPGRSWELELVMANNAGRAIDARILCSFRNGQRRVQDVAVLLRDVGPGDRVAAVVDGPPVTAFVDNTPCNVLSPLE
jgi:hypothetical protein